MGQALAINNSVMNARSKIVTLVALLQSNTDITAFAQAYGITVPVKPLVADSAANTVEEVKSNRVVSPAIEHSTDSIETITSIQSPAEDKSHK